MMLDMKRTFDEVVRAHATPEKAAQILANPFYQAVSSSFAGTQEYMAMEKLGQLRAQADRDGTWDLIVVDTPPSRSALDFLDAPKRLGSFLDGRFIRLLPAPAKAGGRAYLKVFSQGVQRGHAVLDKVLGGQLLTDVQTFVAALDTMFGGFRERADQTYALLKEGGTAFLVVAAPERDALREASYFVDRLDEERMPLAGLVLNRVSRVAAPGLSASRALSAAEQLLDGGGRRRPGQRGDRRPGCCGCTPPRPSARPGTSSWPGASPPGTPGSRWSRCRRPPRTSTTSRACGRSARPSQAGEPDRADRPALTATSPASSPIRPGPDDVGVAAQAGRPGAVAGRLEQGAPGADVGPALEQRAALALGHAAPHAELGAVVEGVGEALGDDRAARGRPSWPAAGRRPGRTARRGRRSRRHRAGPSPRPSWCGSSGRCGGPS